MTTLTQEPEQELKEPSRMINKELRFEIDSTLDRLTSGAHMSEAEEAAMKDRAAECARILLDRQSRT